MTNVIGSVSTLLLSVAVLLFGHGLQLTLAPLFASELGWSAQMIGYTGSAYFTGFLIGCLTIPKLVERVGHIRVFAVLAALATVAVLILGLVHKFEAWLFARALTGWCFAGLYMVIESWLNERAGGEHRGAVLSIYTIITLAAIAGGQLAVGIGLDYPSLTMVAAIVLALGLVPVGLTRSPAPPIETVSFKLKEVFQASHVAVVGAFAGGAVTSGIWALGPVVAQSMGMGPEQIGLFMAITILGGAAFQYPLGRFSDMTDRRRVLLFATVMGSLLCLGVILIGHLDRTYFVYGLMFLFGGVTFPIYSLCVAHANDNSKLNILEIASVILMMHSAGSILGPIVVAPLLELTEKGLFMFSGVVLGVFSIWTSWELRVHEATGRFFAPFIGLPRTTHEIAYVLDETVEPDLYHTPYDPTDVDEGAVERAEA